MSYVFVSYCRESQTAAQALEQDLLGLGHRVWLDRELAGGHAWWDQILGVIRECDVFLFALAPESLESVACRREYRYAAALGKTILPVLMTDGVSVNLLPPELSEIQHVDYRRQDKKAAISVLKALSCLPASRPLPDPLPAPPSAPISYLGSLLEQIQATDELSFQEQAALLLKVKERGAGAEHGEELRTLLCQFRKRDDLFARVAEEIDALLTSDPNPKPPPNRRRVEPQYFAPNAPEPRGSTMSGTKGEPTTRPFSSAAKLASVNKWRIPRLLLKGLFSLMLGMYLGAALAAALSEVGAISRYDRDGALIVFIPLGVVVIWLVLTWFGRRFRREGHGG